VLAPEGGHTFDVDALARLDAVLARPSGGDFEHVGDGTIDRAGVVVERRCIFDDPRHETFAIDEEHVERDAAVVHPEGANRRLGPGEEHPFVVGNPLPVHHAALVVFVLEHELHLEPRRVFRFGKGDVAHGDHRRTPGRVLGASRIEAVARGRRGRRWCLANAGRPWAGRGDCGRRESRGAIRRHRRHGGGRLGRHFFTARPQRKKAAKTHHHGHEGGRSARLHGRVSTINEATRTDTA